MKKLLLLLTVVISAAVASVHAAGVESLALEQMAPASQVFTTITNPTGVLTIVFQHVEGVAPPDQLLLILHTKSGVNFKQGSLALSMDGTRHLLSCTTQSPVLHDGGATEVALHFIPAGELRRLRTTKQLTVSFEGANNRAIFHIANADVLFKNFFEAAAAK